MKSHTVTLSPTPEMQRFTVVPVAATEYFTLTGLQVDLRFSWWAPVVASDGDPSLGFADVTPALDGRAAVNLAPSGSPVVRADAQWQWSNQVNGSTDYFSTADATALNVEADQDVTFAAWVKFTGILPLVGARPILSKMTGATSGEYLLELVPNLNGSPRLRFTFITSAGRLYQVTSFGNLPVNVWVLCVGYFDARRSRCGCIVNAGGTEIRASSAGTYETTADFQIGANTNAAPSLRYFEGRIDEVTRWNRLLTLEEMTWLRENDLWNGVIPVSRAASGDPLEYPTDETDLPAAPSNLEAVADGADEVDLAWQDNAVGLGNVEVYRRIDAGAFALIATIDNTLGYYHDADADVAAHSYDYKVRATNMYGASAYSSTASPSPSTAPAFQFDADTNSQNLALL